MKNVVPITGILIFAGALGCGADEATVAGRVCGTASDVADRIESCATRRCLAGAAKEAHEVPCSGPHEGEWRLITRTALHCEAWRDEGSGLIWGDDGTRPVSQREAVAACMDPVGSQTSACGVPVSFRLPTIEEFRQADGHGLLSALPRVRAVLWWSSTPEGDSDAWYYEDGAAGHQGRDAQDEYFRHHCVAK
jgi:hypothetical protein